MPNFPVNSKTMSDTKQSLRIIWRIARTELAALFGSPIAWFILVVFCVLTTSDFVKALCACINSYALNPNLQISYSTSLFLGQYGHFNSIVANLFIYIPLLTMGLIARETSSGSVKLVYSSPVTSLQYVLGKYIAVAIMGLCLMAIPMIELAGSALCIANVDFAAILTGMLGLYLLICACSAIGLFMSSLTSYQVVAAVGTLAAIAVLGRIGGMGQEYELVQNITRWLCINGRTTSFINGVLRTDDLFYFIGFIVMFISLTVFRLSAPRRGWNAWQKSACLGALACAILAMGYASSRPNLIGIYDCTRNKANSITQNSKDVVNAIEGKIVINNYYNLFDKDSTPHIVQKGVKRSLFEQYKLAKPDIEEHDIYYYAKGQGSILSGAKFADMDIMDARDYFVIVYELNPRIFHSPDDIKDQTAILEDNYAFIREIIGPDGKVAYLRDYADNMREPSEAEITAAFGKLLGNPPVVAFMTGNGERELSGRSTADYSDFAAYKKSRYSLVNQGFDVVYSSFDNPVPQQIEMIVVADPRQEFTPAQMENYRSYIERGGSMMILADYKGLDAVQPLLREIGISASDRQLACRETDMAASLIEAKPVPGAEQQIHAFHDLCGRNGVITMPGSLALAPLADDKGFTRTRLLQTSANAWLESDYSGFRDDVVSCDPQQGDTPGQFCTAYALQRNVGDTSQRIVVLGDGDCLSNGELSIIREGIDQANYKLIVKGFRWISQDRFPVEIIREANTDSSITVSERAIPFVKAIYRYILPLLILAAALAVLLGRRRG